MLCLLYASNHLFVYPHSIELAQAHDLVPIVSSLSNAGKNAQRTLRSVRLSSSAELESVKPKHYSLILRAELKFSENRGLCVEFFRECVRYGKNVVMTCTAFVAHSPFSRSRNSQDLIDDAARLRTERTEVSDETAVQPGGASSYITTYWSLMLIIARQICGDPTPSIRRAYHCCNGWIPNLALCSVASLSGLPSWMPTRPSQH